MRSLCLALCLALTLALSVEAASGALDPPGHAASIAKKKKCKRGYTRNKRGHCVKRRRSANSESTDTSTARPFVTTDSTALFTQLLSGAKLARVTTTTRQLPVPTPDLPSLPTLPTTGLPIPTPDLPTQGLPTLPTTGLPIPTTGSGSGSGGSTSGSGSPVPGSPLPTPGLPIPTLHNEGYFFCAGGKLAYNAESVAGSGDVSAIAWQGTWKVTAAVSQGDLVSGVVKYTTNSTATPPGPSGVIVIDLYRSTQQAFIGVAPGVGLEYQRLAGQGVGC